MTAAALLREAGRAGVTLRLVDGQPKLSGSPSPELLAPLRAHKPELMALLSGGGCRRCGATLPPAPAPLGSLIVFADGSAECMPCAERKVGRLLAAGRRAVNPALAADPAEVMLRGEIP